MITRLILSASLIVIANIGLNGRAIAQSANINNDSLAEGCKFSDHTTLLLVPHPTDKRMLSSYAADGGIPATITVNCNSNNTITFLISPPTVGSAPRNFQLSFCRSTIEFSGSLNHPSIENNSCSKTVSVTITPTLGQSGRLTLSTATGSSNEQIPTGNYLLKTTITIP